MGRKSREKRLRRENEQYQRFRTAQRAERRGRRVDASPEGYERTAKARGPSGIVEALISRHNQRWQNVPRNAAALTDPVVAALHVVYPLDVALTRRGADFSMAPGDFGGEWPDHLRWAIDSACQVQRMVLTGNAIGAAAIARTQLERWSANRATSNDLTQRDGQSTSDFFDWLWRHETSEVSAGTAWVELSELLHGRGALMAAARWEACDLVRAHDVPRAKQAIDLAETATALSLRQVLLCVVDLLGDQEPDAGFGRILLQMPKSLPSEVQLQRLAGPLWPLTWVNVNAFGDQLAERGAPYERDVVALAQRRETRGLSYSEQSLEAFISRRGRAAATSLRAFQLEREEVGDLFNPNVIAGRELAYILFAEAAALMALWSTGPTSDALVAGSSALRSAFWLWLEDDDRAMVLARSVLEQTARLRAHRTKPNRALELEGHGSQTSTRDWLECAGWRRLSALNRSLGEFSHANPERVRWSGAREVLASLQEPADVALDPIHTARGSALERVAYAFGMEVAKVTAAGFPYLAEALAEVAPRDTGEGEEDVEEWLQRCWANRGAAFGEPDFRRPDAHT